MAARRASAPPNSLRSSAARAAAGTSSRAPGGFRATTDLKGERWLAAALFCQPTKLAQARPTSCAQNAQLRPSSLASPSVGSRRAFGSAHALLALRVLDVCLEQSAPPKLKKTASNSAHPSTEILKNKSHSKTFAGRDVRSASLSGERPERPRKGSQRLRLRRLRSHVAKRANARFELRTAANNAAWNNGTSGRPGLLGLKFQARRPCFFLSPGRSSSIKHVPRRARRRPARPKERRCSGDAS